MRDLHLDLVDNHFQLAPYKKMPEILQTAITLLLFSGDSAYRQFHDGDGIYNLLTTITSGGVDYAQSVLDIMAVSLKDHLLELDPAIKTVNLNVTGDAPYLKVVLSIEYPEDTLVQTLYEA